MAIIYSYPDNLNILLTDMLIGTSTIRVAGKKKNITKNFTVEALGKVISADNPTVWGNIIGDLADQTDLQAALDSKQNSITLTTVGTSGPATLIGSLLNIPNYFATIPTKTSELINDGEDGIHPFITLEDIPPSTIPSLNEVLTAGNTSLLDAKIGDLYLYDTTNNGYGKVIINSSSFKVYDYLNNPIFANEIGGSRVWNTLGVEGLISYSLLTGGRIYSMPDQSGTIALLTDIPAAGVTSVGLTMPAAFNVANSPITSSGDIAVTAAGTASQYIRGDGQLATLPASGGGGSSVNYYLNGSIPSSVPGYFQMDNEAVIGPGTNFPLTGNGLIAQFLTDIGNPNIIEIPGGAWNFEMYFNISSSGGNTKFYIDLLKYDGVSFTLIATGATNPEEITGGTAVDLYLTSLAVPTTTLLATDRLAVRVYIVDNSGGRTATLHTEDNNLCEILTTLARGVTSIDGLTASTQYLAVGTTGTDFNITSIIDTHTFNLPTASATNRGALSTTDWSIFNGKFTLPSLTSGSVLFSDGTTIAQKNSNFFWDNTNNRLGIGTSAPGITFVNNGGSGAVEPVPGSGTVGNAAFIRSVIGLYIGPTSNGSVYLQVQRNDGNTTTYPLRLNPAGGNVMIGTSTDNGGKLQIKAPGALSTDIALKIRDSADAVDLFAVRGTGVATIKSNTFTGQMTFAQTANSTSVITGGPGSENITFGPSNRIFLNASQVSVSTLFQVGSIITSSLSGAAGNALNFSMGSGFVGAAGIVQNHLKITSSVAQQNASPSFNSLYIEPTINNTTTTTAIARGIYYNPILTSLTGTTHRAIETVTGDVILGSTSGNVGIGTTAPFSGLTSLPSGLDIGTFNTVGSEGNLMVRGFSSLGGTARNNYGAVGSNYYMDTAGSIRRRYNDLVSVLDFSAGGFLFRTGGSGAVGSAITLTELMRLNNNGNFLINTTTDNGGKLQVKAPGALSTDIALRVRNSADTADLMTIQGDGRINFNSTLAVGNNNFYSSGENRTKFYSSAQTTDNLQIYTNGGAYGSLYGEIGFLFKNTSTQMASINFDTRAGVAAPFRFFVNPTGASSIDAMDIFRTGEVGIGTSNTNIGGKLQIKAPGALSTDIALRVRNSADTGDLMSLAGNGSLDVTGTDFVINMRGTNPTIRSVSSTTITSLGVWGLPNIGTVGTNNNYPFRIATNAITAIYIPTTQNILIGTTTDIASSKLTIESTTQGFLPPRMTNAQRLAIATPAVGLMVYCTDATEGLYINKSTGWTFIV